MSDTTTITQEKIQSWRERLTSEFSCFNAELGGFTLRLLDALEQAEARAEKAEADAREWKEQIPEECPITSLPYFNSFKNSAGVYQPFYGGPCDVYGIPYKDEDGYLCRKRLCLDSMREEDENMCLEVVEEERMIDLGEAEANVARLTKMVDWLAGQLHEMTEKYDDVICPQEKCHPTGDCIDCWKEAARRSVTDSEVKG